MNKSKAFGTQLPVMERRPRWFVTGILLSISLILSGCETVPQGKRMYPGEMISLRDGSQIHFTREYLIGRPGIGAPGTALMTANNPKTGENFTGSSTLVGINGGKSSGTIVNGFDTSYVNTTTATTKFIAKGVLIGNKGTVIEFNMQIDNGPPMTGTGEAKDNKGGRYHIQYPTGPLFVVPTTPAPATTGG